MIYNEEYNLEDMNDDILCISKIKVAVPCRYVGDDGARLAADEICDAEIGRLLFPLFHPSADIVEPQGDNPRA